MGDVSNFEIKQVTYIAEFYYTQYRNIEEKDDLYSVIWVAYLEKRKEMKSLITSEIFWDAVCDNIEKALDELRRNRNKQYAITSRLSFDKTYGEYNETLENFLPTNKKEFVDKLVFRAFIESLELPKYKIVKMIMKGEEKETIRKLFNLSAAQYDKLIVQIRREFIDFFSIEL